MSSYLTTQQIQLLLAPIDPTRVQHLRGMSHLEAHDIRIHLTRVFGFGRWSQEVICMDLIYESPTTTKNGKEALDVGYKAGVRLTVNAPDGTKLATFTEYAVGAQTQPMYMRGDLHDFAMKTAESQAFKRCAVNLGDMFGLSLYNNGYMGQVVQGTAMWGPTESKALEGVETVPVQPEEQPQQDEEDQQQAQQPQQQPAAQQQAPAPAPEPAAPQQPAQQPQQDPGPDEGLTEAQREVKDSVGFLTPPLRAAFRQAWKKAQLPAGYHKLDANHIQWIHATLDDLMRAESTPVGNPVDEPAHAAVSPERQAQIEQARRQFPNAPQADGPPAGQELEHQYYS